ncbi:MAG TPA: protein kinase [Steroidobacteraceae bacterium]|jgi:DNA-binding NarL/FixJ family response regulator|nr:protein kinase [Steroidobacteraceae bacterium]
MTPASNITVANLAARQDSSMKAASRAARLCLVVHDDLELRLRLASLVRRAVPALESDALGFPALESLSAEQLRSYRAVLLIVEFMKQGADPLTPVERLHRRAPSIPLLVFARHGDERAAIRAMKAGAVDYWPIHSVDVAELAASLQTLLGTTAEPPGIQAPAPPEAPSQALASVSNDPGAYPHIAGYRLLKKIAYSSSATVYLARNSDLAQMVALKVQTIRDLPDVSEESRLRFARECEILSSLNHRSIADVIDFGITPDYLYLALEYFPCGSMRERLKNPVSESDALNYARQIGAALQVVHAAGIVHRDLKPSNIMLTTDNRAVLIDFGSARAQLVGHELSRSDLMTGTPYYVCPEQIGGGDPDQRGDLYSLGVIFYEMLAGRLPFRGTTLTEIFDGHRNVAVPPLPVSRSRFEPLIHRLLAKSPDGRFGSAQEFLDALELIAPAKTPKERSE